MSATLTTAEGHSQLAPGADRAATADRLALLAYGVNLRSRAGAEPRELKRTVAALLDLIVS